MAALGWLLNLGFAGGGVPSVPSAVDIKALYGTLMNSKALISVYRRLEKKKFINNYVYRRLFNTTIPQFKSIYVPVNLKQEPISIVTAFKPEKTKRTEAIKLFDNPVTNIKTENKNNKLPNHLNELIKFRTSLRNKKRPVNYFAINARNRVVRLDERN